MLHSIGLMTKPSRLSFPDHWYKNSGVTRSGHEQLLCQKSTLMFLFFKRMMLESDMKMVWTNELLD